MELKIRRNYPYRGTADGLTTSLRKTFSDHQYAELEIEVNQKYYLQNKQIWKKIGDLLVASINQVAGRSPDYPCNSG